MLSRAVTLVESSHPSDIEIAQGVLDGVLRHRSESWRVGITGVPGAGKSTFIDALGMYLIGQRRAKIAVLSVDPSSPLSGGSILGDKTRMHRLSAHESAFIRPSPSRGHLGGVARHTRETILLCEAAGFTHVLVETVGTGQSETTVRSMTDFLLLLAIPGAGDALQGIKRGIIEMLDGMVINKADGEMKRPAQLAHAEYRSALHLLPPGEDGWTPRVLTCSSLNETGIAEVWAMIEDHRAQQTSVGWFERRRRAQALDSMQELVDEGLENMFRNHPAVQGRLRRLQDQVRKGEITSLSAARELLAAFRPDQ